MRLRKRDTWLIYMSVLMQTLFREDNPYPDLMKDDADCQDVVLMTKRRLVMRTIVLTVARNRIG